MPPETGARMAAIIDGKAAAEAVVAKVRKLAAELAAGGGRPPGLAVVIVGEDPASQVYVASKSRKARECGFLSVQHTLPADTERGRAAEADRRSQCRPADRRHTGAAAAAGADRPGQGDPGNRPGKGRRRLPRRQCRQAGRRRNRRRLRAVHAGRRDAAHRRRARPRPFGADAPSSSAVPTSSASRWPTCCSPPTPP